MSFKYEVLGTVRYGNELEDILKLKGIQDIDSFLNPTISNVESELLLDNIEKARDCLITHINRRNTISLIVDCDFDGYSSSSNIYSYIKRIAPDIEIKFYVHEGKIHGLKDLIKEICLDDSSLVIIPDASSGDVEECTQLLKHGKDVIILDHHNIRNKDGSIPNNPAIVVNNQYSNRATDKAMTGVGITYKFTKLLDKYYGVNYADDYLDLVAVGMIGDRANVLNLQTRYLILEGLKQIANGTSKNKFIRTLVDSQMYSMNNKVTMNGIGYYVCPLVNSLIRLGEFEDKRLMFEAMTNSDKRLMRKVKGKGEVEMSIQEYVLKSCESTNRKQKKLTEESASVLSEEINKFGLDKYPILVVNARDNVDSNSTGLIANRLAEQYQRPCLLMRVKGDICKGSGRGYDKCEILDFNKWCVNTGLFDMVEGHDNAFGCEIKVNQTNILFTLLSQMKHIDEPTYHVYNVYTADNIHDQIIKNVGKYDYIWGNNVTPPIFLIKGITCNKYNINLIGAKQNRIEFTYHNIKFVKQTKGSSLAALYKEIVSTGDNIKFDVVGRFTIDVKNGNVAQVMIDDLIFEKSDAAQGFAFGM